ncbi:MAG: hypothetical protein Q8L49_17745 [Burkholderiaceae bacterium]|nr:hypothetical protein [Burkholderiaceae bacterium]
MDREVIEQKLESLRHCLRRIEAKCPADAQTLSTDPVAKDHLVDFSEFARVVALECI